MTPVCFQELGVASTFPNRFLSVLWEDPQVGSRTERGWCGVVLAVKGPAQSSRALGRSEDV